MSKPTIQIDIVSDVVCPWCYIGKRRLEKAIDQLSGEFDFKVSFKPFELNPQMPKEGRNQKAYLVAKFGSEEKYHQITQHVAQTAAAEGLKFDFQAQEISPNTVDAHRLIWLAEQEGVQPQVKEALLKAYFEEGKNLTDANVLLEVVASAGLFREKAEAVLKSDLYLKEVKESEVMSMQRGVSGVPFFVINNQYGISGAQPAEVFVNALKQIGSEVALSGEACDVESKEC